MTTGDRIKHYRKKKKMTQSDLAGRIGLTNNAIISKYENGQIIPKIDTLSEIATALDVNIYDLLENGDILKEEHENITNSFLNAIGLSFFSQEMTEYEELQKKASVHGLTKEEAKRHKDLYYKIEIQSAACIINGFDIYIEQLNSEGLDEASKIFHYAEWQLEKLTLIPEYCKKHMDLIPKEDSNE